MIKVTAVNHVALRINGTERAREFYGEVLGLATVPVPSISPEQGRKMLDEIAGSRDLPRPTGGQWFRAGNTQLHLISSQKREGVINPFGPHVALEVEDLEETKRTLRERGIEYIAAGAQQVWVLDPDGNTIELRSAR